MKLSSILVLAAIVGTSTAAETGCCDALASKGCDAASAFPVQAMSFTLNDIPMVACCASEGVTSVGMNPTCAGSDIPSAPAPAPVEPSTPTVIDNIDANTPVTIGGSMPGMPDVAAACKALESQFQGCACSVQCQNGETKCLDADSSGCNDAAKKFCVAGSGQLFFSGKTQGRLFLFKRRREFLKMMGG